MNRKIFLILLNLLIIRAAAFGAVSFIESSSIEIKNERIMLQEMRKEQLLFQTNLKDLLDKHAKASAKDKPKVIEELRKLVSFQTDREIKNNRDFLKMQIDRINELENKIKTIEANKNNYIDERVQFFIEQYQQGQNNTIVKRSISVTFQQ
jgi:hypothetical protein